MVIRGSFFEFLFIVFRVHVGLKPLAAIVLRTDVIVK